MKPLKADQQLPVSLSYSAALQALKSKSSPRRTRGLDVSTERGLTERSGEVFLLDILSHRMSDMDLSPSILDKGPIHLGRHSTPFAETASMNSRDSSSPASFHSKITYRRPQFRQLVQGARLGSSFHGINALRSNSDIASALVWNFLSCSSQWASSSITNIQLPLSVERRCFTNQVTIIETPNGISNSMNTSSEVCGTSIPAVSQFERYPQNTSTFRDF